ncbi:universal stress protein [Taibaiella soli]|uniref:UspA domain-containing protein n=1 Tax=Taibaiella soli TaxID=1649169 RepID=A0A2W2AHI6_9BACT|nr:universal stress protein [Taibaiella soli]PZF74955.1 hypothetical protein DN068_01790 [Taibaiella soli]
MNTILVATNFSATSRNALHYISELMKDQEDVSITLLHTYLIPITYTGEGVALTAVKDALVDVEEKMNDEAEWLQENYPQFKANTKILVGDLQDGIETILDDNDNITLIVMGAPGEYSELTGWDKDVLNVLIELPVPVLTVPAHISYQPIRNIAFAADFRSKIEHVPQNGVARMKEVTGAHLHIVNVVADPTQENEHWRAGKIRLQEIFGENDVTYHVMREPKIVDCIIHFVEENKIDCLFVMPGRHGFWYNLFHKSHTKQLAKLNKLPIIALHGL